MRQLTLRLQRWLSARQADDAIFARLLRSSLPLATAKFDELEFLCLDVETTGIDAQTADILSIGWVVIRGGRVEIASSEYAIVRPPGEVGDSATVHGLTDTQCEVGEDVRPVLERLLDVLRDRVLVVHYAGLDKALLDRLCRHYYGAALLMPVVDTLELERRTQSRRHHVDDKQSLRLGDLRRAYSLPQYSQHDALADAIAAGELLLAMVAARGGQRNVRLRDLLC